MRANLKSVIKLLMGVTLSIAVVFSTGNVAKAYTSDQVSLSESRPGLGSVTASNGLNVRSSASTSGAKLTALAYGTNVMIVERCSNGWYKVQYDGSGNYGYVSGSYLWEYDMDYYCVANTGRNNLNVRAGQGTNYSIVASIPSGKGVPELVYTGNWDDIIYGTQMGYICLDYARRSHY
ncbi:MAG: hypothetical protein E7296_13155 [Lachnospiraceae bacterium]|jgi:uncharacterized protein YgiM (DUF1202 family)|nr:hypothetical protein [Lachnospiraceae bacterium]